MADRNNQNPQKTSFHGLPPPEVELDTSSSVQNEQITINVPVAETPAETVCSYNKCEGCKALYPIQGLALVNCPGCQQPTLLVKLTNCPKCNEPTKIIKLRVDHVTDKMPHGALCKGQPMLGDVFLVEIEKPVWRDDDKRIKDTSKSNQTVSNSNVEEKNSKDQTKLEEREHNSKGDECGCRKAKTG